MTSEWNHFALGEITELVIDYRGKTPKKLGGDWCKQGYRALSAKNIKTGRIVQAETIRYIDESLYRKWMKDEVQRGDILITSEAPFGQIFFWDSDEKIVLSQRLFCVRIKPEYDARFIYYYMTTPEFQSELDGRATGTTVIGLRQPELMKCVIRCPEIQEQKVIAAILSSIDAKIIANEKVNDNLQQQLFSLYENMAMTSPCLKEYTLSNLCDFQEGYVNPPQTHPEYFDGEVKWLRAVDINESFIIETSRTLTKAGFESAKKSALLFEPSTIAISKSGTIGRLGIIADYMCGNRAVINIAPHDTNMLAFIYCFLKSKQREFPDMAVGSVQKNLYVSLLEPLSVSVPDNESLTAFNAVGASILGMIHNNCVENKNLTNLRDTILPKLMSGAIDVSAVKL